MEVIRLSSLILSRWIAPTLLRTAARAERRAQNPSAEKGRISRCVSGAEGEGHGTRVF